MTRVLITGATGFIGRQCLPFLTQKGFDVHAVFSKNIPFELDGVTWHKTNLLDTNQSINIIKKLSPTHLLHLAWIATPGIYTHSLDNLAWVKSSIDLMQAFASSGGKRLVVAGTCFEYNLDYGYCREYHTPLEPFTIYGASKHAVQCILQKFSSDTGLSSAWGRIFFLYGPYEHPNRLVSSVIKSLLKNEEAHCSSGTQIRDFLYVADVARAFVELLTSNITGPINIASGQPVTVKEVIFSIAELLGRQNLVKLGVLKPRTVEQALLVADTSRLYNELNFFPQYDLKNGLNNTIKWWENQLN